jgi:hypothetical protein
MENTKLTPIVVKRRDDRWEFVPSSTLASLMIGGFVAGSALYLYLSTYFIRSANPLIGVTLLLAGVLIGAMAIRAWRTRNTPLNVENGGRVSYGEKELCAAGTVCSVRIVPSLGGEVGDCEVRWNWQMEARSRFRRSTSPVSDRASTHGHSPQNSQRH